MYTDRRDDVVDDEAIEDITGGERGFRISQANGSSLPFYPPPIRKYVCVTIIILVMCLYILNTTYYLIPLIMTVKTSADLLATLLPV